jgi:hypothetical protein
MKGGRPGLDNGDMTTQFLQYFSVEGLQRCFPRVYFPAWEFPETGERLTGWTLRQQHTPIFSADDSADDIEGLRCGEHVIFGFRWLGPNSRSQAMRAPTQHTDRNPV